LFILINLHGQPVTVTLSGAAQPETVVLDRYGWSVLDRSTD
jgi:hypothetical protein